MLPLFPRTRARKEDGFTLLELMAVVGIIGTLTAIAMPSVASQSKAEIDSGTKANVGYVADAIQQRAASGQKAETLTLDALSGDFQKNSLYKGTVLGLTRGLTGYCLTAYNPKGDKNASKPFVYDTAIREFVTDPTTNCISLKPVGPSYVVDDKRHLMPMDSGDKANAESHCHNVVPAVVGGYVSKSDAPGVAKGNLWGYTADRSVVQLEGSLTLNPSCTAIDYDLRVVHAEQGKTYFIDVKASSLKKTGDEENPWAMVNGPGQRIVINGTERVQTAPSGATVSAIPTGVDENTNPESVTLLGGLHANRASTPQDEPRWTSMGGAL